ncbi:hypothetical protein HQ447_01010 [bacterium]|nr:hypothetical protein [bacterium]
MNPSETIVCKPTPWFLLRAVVMLLMFGVFAVLFYVDGSTGYRKKNEGFYLHETFQLANSEFSKMNSNGALTAEEWKRHAEKQVVEFPTDRSVLPADLKLPMPWPAILHDFEGMKPLQWNILWREYSKQRGLNASPPEEPYTAAKIHEQWTVFAICAALAAIAAFFLLRTIKRSISVDEVALTNQQGKRIPFADFKTLDLRKWETKGLAFIDYEGASGKGRIRLDGLTYGGFKKENDEPAERLMRRIRSRFSGEIIEYSSTAEPESKNGNSTAT